MQSKQKLLSGRVLGLVATLSGICFCAAIFQPSSSSKTWLLAAGTIGIILCLVGTLWWMKTSYSSLKGLLSQGNKDSKALHAQLSESLNSQKSLRAEQVELARSLRHFRKQVDLELANLKNGLISSDSEILSRQDELKSKLNEIQGLQKKKHLHDLELQERQAQEGPKNFYSPNQISSVEILAKPDAFSAGRQAAAQKMAGDTEKSLQAILNGDQEEYSRYLTGIVCSALQTKLKDVGDFKPVFPGQGQPDIDARVSYFIIEESALKSRPWQGTLNTTNTQNFMRLLQLIKQARSQNTVVIFISEGTPSAFTGTVAQNSDLVISGDSSDFRWERDADLPVINLLHDYAEGKLDNE